MISLSDGDLKWYGFDSISDGQVIHGVFTRLGGLSQGSFAGLNVGHTVGDDPGHVEANHRAIYRTLHVWPGGVVTAHQVHGDRVAVVSREDGGKILSETDALISNVPGLTLVLRFADCVPVFFYAPPGDPGVAVGAVGLAHAGWKGTVKRIAAKTAQAMCSSFGYEPEELHVGLGPAIGPCCFEVGPEVIEQVCAEFDAPVGLLSHPHPNGKAHLDLWLANELQLREIGVTHIETMDICTCCHRDEFFSHRGEGGRTGRFAALIGLREGDSSP